MTNFNIADVWEPVSYTHLPLLAGSGDEVVDHDLGTVGKVTELRLPGDEGPCRLYGVCLLYTSRCV